MQLEVLVATAHRRLALRRLLVAIERDPNLLEAITMVLKIEKTPLKIGKPTELAGLKSRLIRADAQHKTIARIGERYDAVLDGIDELTAAHTEHVGDLEHYEFDLRRKIESMVSSNGGVPLDGEAGQTGQAGQSEGGQVISSETKA